MKEYSCQHRMVTRLTGTIQIVLGALFWTGYALSLIPVHMLVGLILVLCLWALAGVAAGSGGNLGLVVLAFVWGALVPCWVSPRLRFCPARRTGSSSSCTCCSALAPSALPSDWLRPSSGRAGPR